jgi:hypothetical protein
MTDLTQWARSLFKEISEPGNGRHGAMPGSASAQATGNVGGSAGRSHSVVMLPTESPANVPVAPDFRYRPVTTSVRRRG